MWDLNKLLVTVGPFLPIVVLAISLLGSPHCLIMCGVFTYQIPQASLWKYHLGRLVSYILLATLFLYLYQIAFEFVLLQITISLLFLLYFAFLFYKEQTSCCKFKVSSTSYFFRGIANGILPCSWLFLFLISLQFVDNKMMYFALMALFWLGTVPVFYLRYIKPLQKHLGAFHFKQKNILLICLFFLSFSLHLSGLSIGKEVHPLLLQCLSFITSR